MIARDISDREIKVGDKVVMFGVVEREGDHHGVSVRVAEGLSVYVSPRALKVRSDDDKPNR